MIILKLKLVNSFCRLWHFAAGLLESFSGIVCGYLSNSFLTFVFLLKLKYQIRHTFKT